MSKTVSRVVLGVTGGIAAYKAPEVVRGLVKKGVAVRCVLTPNAARFVAPLTLAALSRQPVAQTMYDPTAVPMSAVATLWEMEHLSLASWADLVLVAPATADFIARLAQGRAEGLLDALVLSARAPVAVCPAMDAEMWAHPATKANVARIKEYGYRVLGPELGELASGKVGLGRLLDPDEIVRAVLK